MFLKRGGEEEEREKGFKSLYSSFSKSDNPLDQPRFPFSCHLWNKNYAVLPNNEHGGGKVCQRIHMTR